MRSVEELRRVAGLMRELGSEDALLLSVADWMDEEATEAETGDTYFVHESVWRVADAFMAKPAGR